MNNDWQKDYPSHQELNEKDLDDNSSLKKMLRLVGEGKRVIDFGCATGYFSQLLTKKGCNVTGVEINPEAAKFAEQYCEQVIVADLDFVSVTAILPKQAFDVAVFGDVLEHLRNPWKVLSEIRQLLKPEGYVVASIPNIAHGAIRLALLQGRFEYMDLGLLDNTHLRFFTRKSVEELFEGSGYFVETIERTKLPVISASTWVPRIDKNTFDPKIIQQIEQAAEADTFQFVVRAFPLSDNGKYAALKAQNAQLVLELEQAQSQLHQTQTAWEQTQSQVHQTQVVLEQTQTQLHETQAAWEQAQSQLHETQAAWDQAQSQVHQTQAVLEQTQTQLHETQAAWEQAQSQLHETQAAWDQAQSHNHRLQAELMQCLDKVSKTQFQLQEEQAELEQFQSQLQQTHTQAQQMQETIVAMQSSKFWKIRTFWFRFKKPFLRNS
jgi:2-polyprenyl-3-methyl-5-hydroxy-6-metoxy-1,4-benzoquinol methylase/peptidoglycan hydrolase CwlO-like protein